MTRVICDTCGAVLQEGPDPVVKKRCFQCVRTTTPKSPDGRIVGANGAPVGNREQRRQKQKPPSIMMNYQWMEESTENPKKEIVLMISVQTYEKKVLFEVGLPLHKLEEYVADMKEQQQEAEIAELTGGSPTPEDS